MASPEEEDFTFPATTTRPPPRFIDSPPIWWRQRSFSPTPGHKKSKNFKDKEVLQGEDKKFNFCSLQVLKASTIGQKKSSSCDIGDEKEEKMDMLWENLNEKFSTQKGYIPSPERGVNAKALKLSKANGHLVSGQKPSILVFISVLKKALVTRNSRQSIKKRVW